MLKLLRPLLFFLLALGAVLFLAAIVTAGLAYCDCKIKNECLLCLKREDFFYGIGSYLSSLTIILATNFGATIGAAAKQPDTRFGSGLHMERTLQRFNSFRRTDGSIKGTELAKVIACYVYIIGLITAVVFYLIGKSDNAACVDISSIPGLANSFFGAIIGAVAAYLGAPVPDPNPNPTRSN